MGTVRKGTLALVVVLGVAVSVLGWLIGLSILTSVLQYRVAAQPVPGTVTPAPTATPPSPTEAPTDSEEDAGDDANQPIGSEECAAGEVYDPESQHCLLDCDTEEECEQLDAQLEAELDEYFEGSETGFPPGSSDVEEPAGDGSETDSESSDGTTDDGGQPADEVSIFYDVQPDLSLSPEPKPEHQKLWEMFVTVISKEFAAERVAGFWVYDDFNSGVSAAVREATATGKWNVEFNLAETGDMRELIHTMIHEYGHLLTLNDTQVEGGVGGACPRFRYYSGCAKPDSYLDAFYTKFWQKYGEQSMQIEIEEDLFDTQPADTFVDYYAATNMLEDMADTWAAFVLREKPTGDTEADAKIRFFYDYPELVQERDRIRRVVSKYIS